jgi:hypothetical protein
MKQIKEIEWKYEIGQRIIDDKRDITIIDRKKENSPYNKNAIVKYYKYHCNRCEFECGEHFNSIKKIYKFEYWC